jgi:carbon storage regulator
MLILTRKENQSIIINKNIKITFLGIGSYGQGRIGIDAPIDISIHREEIQERINNGEIQDGKSKIL